MGARYVPIIFTADGDKAFEVVKKMTNAFEDLDSKSEKAASGGLRNVFIQADLASRAISHGTREIIAAAKEYLQFGREISNLNTLLDDASSATKFRDGLLGLDPFLGQTSELARGMYQAISSGVKETDGLDAITVSAKAARAGLATTFETVDMGTSVMASFNLQGKDLTSIYDKAFETVKRGKVEFPQLAQNIGQVSSFAAEAGVSIDEMFAVIATGSRTTRPAQVIEGLRSALSNIVKPSSEAKKLAQELGIDFSASALKAKGLAQFLNEVSTAAGGDVDKLSVLFGDVQALNVVLKLTGSNSKQFAEDLKGIASASGTVDEAFKKQKESIGAQWDALKVQIQQGVIKTLVMAQPVISLVIKLFAAAPLPVGLFTAALVLMNTAALTSGGMLGKLISNITLLGKVMLGQAGLIQGAASTILTRFLGWGAVLVLGYQLINWLTDFGSATEAASKVTREQVEAQAKMVQSNTANVATVKELAKAQSLSADEHERLNAIIATLDPGTQSYIKALDDEKEKIKEVTKALQDKANADKDSLKAQELIFGAAIVKAQQDIQREKDIIENLKSYKLQAEQEIANAAKEGRTVDPNVTRSVLQYAQGIGAANEKINELNKSVGENSVKLAVAARGLEQNKEQMLEVFRAAGWQADSLKNLSDAYDAAMGAINATTSAMDNGTAAAGRMVPMFNLAAAAVDNTRNSVSDLRKELAKLAEGPQGKIDQAIYDVVKDAKDKADAKRRAQDAVNNKPELKDAVQERRRITEAEAGAREVFEPSTRSGGGGGRPVNVVRDTTREVTKLRQEVEALKRGGGKLFDLKVEREDLEAVKNEYTELLKLRRQLHVNEAEALPLEESARRAELRDLQALKQTQEKVVDLARQLHLPNPALPKTLAEATKMAEAYQQEIDTGRDLEQQLKSLKDHLFDLGARTEDGRTNVEKFDYWLKTLTESGKITKEQLDRLAESFNKVREAAGLADQAELNARQQAASRTLDTSLTDMRRELLRNKSDLDRVGELNPLETMLRSLEDLKQLNLQAGALDPINALLDKGLSKQKDFDNLRQQITGIVTAANEAQKQIDPSKALDDAKLKEHVIDIETLVLWANKLRAEVTPAKQAMRDLNKEFNSLQREAKAIETITGSPELLRNQIQAERNRLNREFAEGQNQIAVESETAALRYRNAWQRANNDVSRADSDAIESMIESRVKLADAQVYHEARANAKILQFLAQQKSVTDIVADAKIGIFQKTFDGIDAMLDRIIPKMHGLGDLFKQIIGDLLKLEAKKWLMKLLGLETGDGGEVLTSHGSGGGKGGSLSLGNIWSNIKNIFSPGSTAASAASLIPSIGGAGTSAASSLAIHEGLHGGSAAAGGGLSFAKLGAFLTNPWTIGIAAAAIGGFMLWKHFKNGTEKKLRETIGSEYGVQVKDMAMLKQIKEIGEQNFGKGQVSKHLLETVRLDAVKEIISAYAEQTGQQAKGLTTNAQLQDPNNPLNRFGGFREFGGSVTPGMAYIVGEKRPELFVPDEPGYIVPSVPEPSGPRKARGGAQSGSMPPAMAAAFVGVMGRAAEVIERLEAKIKAMRPGDVVGIGAEENPEAFAEGTDRGLSRSHTARNNIGEKLGLRK